MAVKGISAISGKQAEYVADGARASVAGQQESARWDPTRGSKNGALNRESVYEADDILEVVGDLNNAVDVLNKGLHFRVHEATERIMVEVIDKDTGDVIREIPPEYILDIMAKIDALFGVFVDEKV